MTKNPRSKPATMHDVARHAGVSVKTVSNVINDWPYVTPETRQKVWDAIQAVQYRPNLTARSLVTGKTHTVGVIVPDLSNPFFGSAIRGCEDELLESQYSLLLCNANEDAERERYYLNLLVSRAVDAVITWGSRLTQAELSLIVGDQIPLLTIDASEPPTAANHLNVDIDNIAGARLATQHLIEQGYRRIAHFAGPEGRVTAKHRLAGYRQALEMTGQPYDPALVASQTPTIQGGYVLAQAFMRQDRRPDAIFCYNDLMAIGVLLACRQFGWQVPGEVGLVGFDDLPMATLMDPPLTTVRIAQYPLGRLTGRLVLDAIKNASRPQQSVPYLVELQVRGSSGKGLLTENGRRAMVESLMASLGEDRLGQPAPAATVDPRQTPDSAG